MRLYEPEDGGRRAGAALRWGTAGLIVAGVHLGAGWWLVSHSFAAPPPDQAQGIPIDLEPVAEPQNAPAPNSAAAAGPAPAPQAAAAPDPALPADAPQPTAAEPPDPTPPPPDVVPPAPEPPPQVTEATPPPPEPPQVQSPPEPPPPVPPPPPRDTKSDAVLAPAPPPRPKAPPKSDPRVLAREAAKRKALAEKRAQDRAERVAARAQARAARLQEGGGAAAAAAAPSSASSGADVASWRGAVVAHLNSFKPASNGASGTARVAFAVDRNGRVLGASLAGSSGDPQLDDAAVAMVRRASPVPAPPPELGGRINLTVPVRFH